MYSITKQTIIGNKVVANEIIGYTDTFAVDYIANKLKVYSEVIKTSNSLINDHHKIRFIIERVKIDNMELIKAIDSDINAQIKVMNNYINCANNVAIKSAQQQNADKVNLIKKVKVEDFNAVSQVGYVSDIAVID